MVLEEIRKETRTNDKRELPTHTHTPHTPHTHTPHTPHTHTYTHTHTHTHSLCVLCAVEGSSKVLVVANDERTCYQLRQYLCEGGQRLLEKQLSRLNPTVDTTASKSLKRSLPSEVGGASKKRKTDAVEQWCIWVIH